MATVNEKMTALADEIRTLSGTTGTMGLDAMATHVGEANTDVATEADLIAQIAGALEGKAAGGGNDTPTNITLNFSWTATSSSYIPAVFYSYIDENGDYVGSVYLTQTTTSGSTTLTVAKKSIICIVCRNTASESYGVVTCSMTDGISKIDNRQPSTRYRKSLYLVTNDGQLTVGMGYSTLHGGGSN